MRRVLAILIVPCLLIISWPASRAFAAPLSLDSLLVAAVARNAETLAADREVASARARLRQARGLEAPSLSYETGKLGIGERESSLRFSQALPFPSQRSRGIRVAEAEVGIAEARRESVALRVRRELTRAYRLLQSDVLNLRALDNLRSVAMDLEDLVRVRIGTGGATYLDHLRLRAGRVTLENEIIESERARREHQESLRTLAALPGADPIEPGDSLTFVPLVDSLSVFLTEAARSRPGIRAARLEVVRERASVDAAKAGRFPTTELSAGLDWVAGIDGPGWGGEISVGIPFAPWTDRRGRVAESEANQGTAEARLLAAERALEATVRNAYVSVRSTQRQLASFEETLIQDAEDAIQAAIQNYRAGQIDGLELFETLRAYRTIQIEHVRAILNYELARLDLYTAE